MYVFSKLEYSVVNLPPKSVFKIMIIKLIFNFDHKSLRVFYKDGHIKHKNILNYTCNLPILKQNNKYLYTWSFFIPFLLNDLFVRSSCQ